ncbi:hypothetical protein [Aureimonas sp. N4]|uniref:hypothetical protein n=1 Tax=Aureimonas sp. N4 TaxID=1638165 RepID=UPI00078351DC|nr:hypothetical protein [Aureimonas sp. N4]
MPKNPNPPPPREVRTFVNPIAIRYDTPDGHTFHYYREWHGLTLRIDDYRLTRSLASTERDFGAGHQEGDDEILKAAYADYAGMSADDRQRLEDIQRREIVLARNPDVRRLEGWGEIVNKRTVQVFEAGRDGKPQGDYDRRFRRIHVNVRSFGGDDQVGSMFLWSGDRQDPVSDENEYLSVDIAVRAEVLEALERTIRETGAAPVLTMHLDALLYQTEVERSLAEPWHPQDYAMLRESYAGVSMSHLIWDVAERKASPEEEADVEVPRDARASPAPAAPQTDVARRIRGLATAVWGLAAAVVVAAILR